MACASAFLRTTHGTSSANGERRSVIVGKIQWEWPPLDPLLEPLPEYPPPLVTQPPSNTANNAVATTHIFFDITFSLS